MGLLWLLLIILHVCTYYLCMSHKILSGVVVKFVDLRFCQLSLHYGVTFC